MRRKPEWGFTGIRPAKTDSWQPEELRAVYEAARRSAGDQLGDPYLYFRLRWMGRPQTELRRMLNHVRRFPPQKAREPRLVGGVLYDFGAYSFRQLAVDVYAGYAW